MQKILAISTAALFCGGCYFNIDKIDKLYAEKDELQKQCFELQADLKIQNAEYKNLAEVNAALTEKFAAQQNQLAECNAKSAEAAEQAKSLYNVVDIVENCYNRNYGRFNDEIMLKYMNEIIPKPPVDKNQMQIFLSKLNRLNLDNSSAAYAKMSAFIAEQKGEYLEFFLAQPVNNYMLVNILSPLLTKADKPVIFKNPTQYAHYVNAIMQLIDTSDKKFILDNLESNPAFITIVINKNWTKDALDIIVKKLDGEANFNYYQQFVHAAIKELPPEKAQPLMEKIWNKYISEARANNNNWNLLEFAFPFAGAGYLPSFLYLIDNSNLFANDNYRVGRFLQLSNLKDIQKLQEIRRDGKADFVFDSERRLFTVRPKAENQEEKK